MSFRVGVLSEIAVIEMGQSPKGELCNTSGEGVPLLNGPTEFGSRYPVPIQYTIEPKKRAQKGDLLFCVRGSTTGRMNWADQEYAIGRGLAAISPIHKNTSNFVRAAIEYKLEELLNIATGSTFPNLQKKMIENLSVSIPNVSEMLKINSFFYSIDEKIEVNNQIKKILEDMAKAIFKEWFLDFEFPNEEGELYKSSGGKMVESELGKIPEGWEIKEINDISSNISKGTTPKSKDINSATDKKDIYFIKVKDIQTDGYINYINVEKIPKSIHLNSLKRSILEEKDILLSIAGTIGRISYISDVYNGVNSNQAIAFIRLKDSAKYFNFLLYYMKSSIFQNEISSKIVQAVQANVSLSVIKAIRLVLPNDSNLKKFNEVIQPIVTKIEILRNENESLIGIRESLMPKLLSGEIEL